jgi:hypothetical protein
MREWKHLDRGGGEEDQRKRRREERSNKPFDPTGTNGLAA